MKVSKKQHEQTSTRLPVVMTVVMVRRKRGGKGREQKRREFVEKKNGSNRSGLGRG